MTTDALPGLSLEVVPAPPEQDVLRTDVAAVLGRTRRGPVGIPVRVQSQLEYESWFGPVDGSSATSLAVRGFFENNGRTVWVLRVAGPAGTASTVWAPGDPLPGGLGYRQYRLLATSPGAWANGTRVRIRYQASSLAGPPAITVRVAAPGEPAETFPAMSPDQLVDQLAGSRLIRLLPIGDPAPTEPPRGPQVREWDLLLEAPPGAQADGAQTSAGTDAPPGADEYRLAAQTAAELPEPALLAAPDLTGDLGNGSIQVLADLLVAVQPLQDRLVVLDVPGQLGSPGQGGPPSPGGPPGQVALRSTGPEPSGLSADAAIGWVNDLRSAVRQRAGSDLPLSCAAVYHPRLRLRWNPDGTDDNLVTVPSAGHVLGVIARLDAERGPHHTPANAVLLEAVDLDPGFPVPQQVRLFEAGVNLLRCSPGRGIQVWGGRTLSTAPGGLYIAHRRLLHLLVRAIRGVAGPLVFEVNGPQLRLTLVRGITSVLLSTYRTGALAGDRPEEAFQIICDERNNPPDQAPEVVVCDVEVAPATPMEFIRIRVILGQERGLEVLES